MTHGMSTFVKSIRVSPDLWGRVEVWAEGREVAPNAAVSMLIEAGLGIGSVAQGLERPPVERRVAGSSPAGAAKGKSTVSDLKESGALVAGSEVASPDETRPAVGTRRRTMARDGKSGAPVAVWDRLVRYDDKGEPVWKREETK